MALAIDSKQSAAKQSALCPFRQYSGRAPAGRTFEEPASSSSSGARRLLGPMLSGAAIWRRREPAVVLACERGGQHQSGHPGTETRGGPVAAREARTRGHHPGTETRGGGASQRHVEKQGHVVIRMSSWHGATAKGWRGPCRRRAARTRGRAGYDTRQGGPCRRRAARTRGRAGYDRRQGRAMSQARGADLRSSGSA